MRKIPGKRAPKREREAARKMRNHPRQAMTEPELQNVTDISV